MAKLTDKTELTSPAYNDFMHIVDVSDIADSADGTSKKVQLATTSQATLAEWYGADPGASAAVNTTAIQEALNIGGVVRIKKVGDYLVNASLVIKSNTTFILDPGVKLKQDTTDHFHFIHNEHYASTLISVSAIAVTATETSHMLTVTVDCLSAHGRSVGDTVLIKGDTTGFWNGFHRVVSVIDPDSFTMEIPSGAGSTGIPSAGAGTMTLAVADTNITIGGGGELDMDFHDGDTFAVDLNYHGIVLNKVLKPIVSNLRFNRVRKYCVCMANVGYPFVSDIYANTLSDGVHIYGPAWSPHVERMYGSYGDDVCIFQCIDGTSYAGHMPADSGGSFYGGGSMLHLHPLNGKNSGIAVLYPNSGQTVDSGYRMNGTYTVEKVSGIMPLSSDGTYEPVSCFTVGNGYVSSPNSYIESIILRDITGRSISLNQSIGVNITIDSFVLDGFSSQSPDTGNDNLFPINNMTINKFIAKNLVLIGRNSNAFISLLSVAAVVKDMLIDGAYLYCPDTASIRLIHSVLGTAGKITVRNCTFARRAQITTDATFTGTPIIIVDNIVNLAANTSHLIAIGGTTPAKIRASNCVTESGSGSVFNFFGTGVIECFCNNMLLAGAAAVNLQTNVAFKNPDGSAPIDIGLVARTSGSIAYNSNASRGTLGAAGLVVCQGTASGSWHLLSDPTLVY